MLVKMDHITFGHPCQLWVQRVTGSMFPILLDEGLFKIFFASWVGAGMPDHFEYDPEENLLRSVESPFFSFAGGVERVN